MVKQSTTFAPALFSAVIAPNTQSNEVDETPTVLRVICAVKLKVMLPTTEQEEISPLFIPAIAPIFSFATLVTVILTFSTTRPTTLPSVPMALNIPP